MKNVLLTAVVLFCALAAPAQRSDAPGYRVRFRAKTLVVTHRGAAHALAVAKFVDAARPETYRLMFAAESNGFRYLVLDVSGPSRVGDPDRQCGAGLESTLIWLKLDSRWKITAADSFRYESCWTGAAADEPVKSTADSISVSYDDVVPAKSYRVEFDKRRPADGLKRGESKR